MLVFNRETWCIKELYWSYLKPFDTGVFCKIVLEVNDDISLKYHGFKEIVNCVDVVRVEVYFDLDNYFSLSNAAKKVTLIEMLHKCMLFLCERYEWDKEAAIQAYELCLENNLEYRFKLKNKTYRSPQRNWYGAIYCDWDLNYFKATARIEDKNGELMKEQELLNIEPYFGEFIYYANCKWDDAYTFSLYSKTGKKWSIQLMSLVADE
ncbi:hypothetical protein IDJ77_24720 [Mucilaginibacter sp. ZT4R22]|uniref:Immunity protein 22 of polymorphic toxin system n=1 Tax=Mucilaginibacter pankratovii TaxID=2772110 RepID=A0ABR7WXX6_9SPHI|nr:hypothetical protein [Mucilaginibacter pankratovii]MBD1367038.1 hypothetical protein [Mucilaginibacter pankratovii]